MEPIGIIHCIPNLQYSSYFDLSFFLERKTEQVFLERCSQKFKDFNVWAQNHFYCSALHYSTLLAVSSVFQVTFKPGFWMQCSCGALRKTSVNNYHSPLGDNFPRCLSVSGVHLALDTGNKPGDLCTGAGRWPNHCCQKESSLQLMLQGFAPYCVR